MIASYDMKSLVTVHSGTLQKCKGEAFKNGLLKVTVHLWHGLGSFFFPFG